MSQYAAWSKNIWPLFAARGPEGVVQQQITVIPEFVSRCPSATTEPVRGPKL